MSALPDLVRDSLTELADTAAVPDGIADRALAAGAVRHRRRTILLAAAAVVAAAAVATPYAVLRADQAAPSGAAGVHNAVFALHRGGSSHLPSKPDPEWDILDPRTGHYRRVVAGKVSAPTADLRYAIVTMLFEGPNRDRIGRYDTTTGEIRWYPAPVPAVSAPQISPDGRHAAYWLDSSDEMEGVAVVDLRTGQVNRIRIKRWPVTTGDERVSQFWSYPPREHAWRLDNDRVTLHDTVYDLAGKPIGSLGLLADASPIALRPDGGGRLIRPVGKTAEARPHDAAADGAFALTDAEGAVTSQFIPELPSCPSAAPDCPRPRPSFLGWRGTDEMMVWAGPGQYDRPETAIDAVDLRTGERHTIHRIGGSPSVDDLVTIPADRLPREVRQRIAF